jgi:hypothetical protein
VEAGTTVPDRARAPELAAELDRIEAAVATGNRDLRALGFWRIVERVKRDRALVGAHADRVGRIDTAVFRAGVRLRAPVWVGMLVLVAGAAAGLAALILAANIDSPGWAGLLLLGAAGVWSVALHCPTHWLVGWLAGIRFTDMFLGGPPPPRPGLKTDYATYLRAEPAMRAWFHASGAIATKLAPFVALAVWPLTEAPSWAAWGLLGLGAILVASDLLFSVRSSDWKKFRRERGVARAILRDP